MSDVGLVGGKNASLGEMIRELSSLGIRVPGGFAVTAEAYRHFLRATGLDASIHEALGELDVRDLAALAERGRLVRQMVLAARLPEEVEAQIVAAYRELSREHGVDELDVAVRSSATAEDLPTASFAGQLESFLNVRGERALLRTCLQCMASLFTDRALSYRSQRGFEEGSVAVSVGVQAMVRSDLACAGVLFTVDTETGFRDVVLINSSWGFGESVVKGRVDPDEIVVHKPTLARGFRPIVKRALGAKQEKVVAALAGDATTEVVATTPEERTSFTLTDDEILGLARWGCSIESHYSDRAGRWAPMDVEWAKDGRTGEMFIVQARPETVQSRASTSRIETFRLCDQGPVLLRGRAVGQGIGAGPVRLLKSAAELADFRAGEVLVADMTDPDWEPTMRLASAVVTNRGGRTCHAAIVSRELGVPCIVGTGTATARLTDGREVTVSCAAGEVGAVYDGALRFERRTVDAGSLRRPRTRILMNVGEPDRALSLAMLPSDGVGLARIEFIISSAIGIHPMALVRLESLADGPAKQRILQATLGYARPVDFFVDRLAQGVGMIAAAFWPRDVIVRMSDFKTNEYARLIGGDAFEPTEENPMIGFRGASRYYDPRYRDAFRLECLAMTRVRDEMGLTNVKLMIPFCRTVQEGEKVLAVMAEAGLVRGERGLEIWVMCEIPSNVVLAADFARTFDGFSIGSNDLTQLTLGLDRDSEILAHLFDERDPAVLRLIEQVIESAHRAGRKVGICGQAPSDYPEMVRWLVERGIDSLSLSPDRVVQTTLDVLRAEGSAADARQEVGEALRAS